MENRVGVVAFRKEWLAGWHYITALFSSILPMLCPLFLKLNDNILLKQTNGAGETKTV
jgi:hypothetical protein